jgi:hypothetical protein
MKIRTRVSVFRNPASRYTELYIWQEQDNKVGVVESLNLKEHELGAAEPPTLLMDDESALELLQSLWDQGYRPNNYQDESAVKYHLEDMRKIAFKFLELP